GCERGRLPQECVGRGEGGGRLEPREDLAGSSEDGVGLNRSGKSEEAPAPAQERERLLCDDPEPLPAIRGLGVSIGGGLEVAPGLGERAVRRYQGVFGQRVPRLEAAHEPPAERP